MDPSPAPVIADGAHDDAQRNLEKRALRNVRSLVDKIEEENQGSRTRTVRFAVITVVCVALVGIAGYGVIIYTGKGRVSRAVVSEPVKAPARTAQ